MNGKQIDENIVAKRYVHQVLLISNVLFLLSISFNWFFDPYDIWQSPRIHGINEFVNVSSHERLNKMIQITRHENTEVLFLGSSTVKKVLFPQTYFAITGFETYNAGFDAARISEMKQELEQAIQFLPRLREVVLGLNWFMFHKAYEGFANEFPQHQVGFQWPVKEQAFLALNSLGAWRDSLRTFRSNRDGIWYNAIDKDGKMNACQLQIEYERSQNLEQFAEDTVAQIPMFKEYQLSSMSLEEYVAIVDLCETHGIKLRVYINPVHSIFLESIYESNGGKEFEEWKRKLATIHPIFDFAHYSKIGNEPFSLQRKYWRNTQHEMPLTGDLVLQRLTGQRLSDEVGEFGFLLTTDNVNQILEKERKARDRWREENPATVEFVKGLVVRY